MKIFNPMKMFDCTSILRFSATWFVLLILSAGLSAQDFPTGPVDLAIAQAMIKEADDLSESSHQPSQAEAEQKYSEALNLCRKLRNARCISYTLFRIGIFAMDRHEFEKALHTLEQALAFENNPDDRRHEARVRAYLGRVYIALGDEKNAESHFQGALSALRETEFPAFLGMVSVDLARLKKKQSRFEESLSFFIQGAEAFRKIGGIDAEIGVLTEIGDLYLDTSQYSQAVSTYENVLGMLSKANDTSDGWIQYRICGVAKKQGNRLSAMKCYEALAKKSRRSNDHFTLDQALNQIGYLYSELGQHTKAIEVRRTMLEDSRRTNNKRAEAFALWALGNSYWILDKHRAALPYFEDSLVIIRLLGEKGVESNILLAKGGVHMGLRQTSDAERSFKLALALSKEIKDPNGELNALTELGNLFHYNDQYKSSLQHFEEALKIATRVGNTKSQVSLLLRIGEAHYGLKQYDEILSKYEKALSIAKNASDKTGEAEALGSISAFYIAVGQFGKARDHLDRTLSIAIETKNTEQEGDALLGLGAAAIGEKEFRGAQTYYERALNLSKATKSEYLRASALIGIGISQMNVSQLEKARETLTEGLRAAEKAEEHYRVADAANELGNVLYKLEKYDDARRFAERALVLGWRLSDPEREGYALFALMRISAKQKRTEEGVFYGKQLINMLQHARQKLKYYGTEVHHGFLKDKEDFYRVLADILISEGRLAEAEEVLDLLKSEEFFDFVRRDDGISDDLLATVSLSPEEKRAFEEYKKYAENLTALGKELGELQVESRQYEIGEFPKRARLDELEKRMANSNIVFTTFLDSLKLKFGEQDVRVSMVESGSQALLKELDEPRTVFISTITGDERLNIIVTTADAQKAYTVPVKNDEINRLVADFRSVLRNPNLDTRVRGKALYDVLFPDGVIKDIANIDADTIVWSLDGTLRYVPISALWDGKHYLLERFNNVVVTLASRDKLNARTAERGKWNALGVGVSKQVSVTESDGTIRNFEALDAVPEELCRVIQDPENNGLCESITTGSPGVIGGQTLLDEKFTFQSFRDSLGRFSVVHVASHFHLNAGNENDSYLLLGGGDNRRLSLAAIRQGGARFVGVDLLTLSACNTAMSAERKANGLEIEGFGALAQRSGAKSVLASLWAVADSSTRDLMIEFYRQVSDGKNVGKAEALRMAQTSLLRGKYELNEVPAWRTMAGDSDQNKSAPAARYTRDPKAPFSHPYYWSPFILIGNWQ